MNTVVDSGTARAALWRLLSLGFLPPREETLAEVEALAEGALELGCPREVEQLLEALRDADRDELGYEYQALFGGTVAVAPYEGSYELDPVRQGRQLADVAGFYRAFGAEAHGPAAERPDHVGCELEFLSFLELRRVLEAEAGDEASAKLLDDIARAFLTDHAGRWLPRFFAEIRARTTDASTFGALATLGERLVEDELERRGLEPSSLPRRHATVAVEHDLFDCGAAG